MIPYPGGHLPVYQLPPSGVLATLEVTRKNDSPNMRSKYGVAALFPKYAKQVRFLTLFLRISERVGALEVILPVIPRCPPSLLTASQWDGRQPPRYLQPRVLTASQRVSGRRRSYLLVIPPVFTSDPASYVWGRRWYNSFP